MCGVGLFCTFQDGICVVWVCFVPLWISFVFLCFRGVQLEAHRTFFTTKMSQNLYCVPLVAHHEWESFVPLKLFYTSWWVNLCGVGLFCSTFFTTKNESKFVLCATGCTPRMGEFCTNEIFFIPAGTKKVSLVRNPFESFESSEKLGG
jgi:hypothetical protein